MSRVRSSTTSSSSMVLAATQRGKRRTAPCCWCSSSPIRLSNWRNYTRSMEELGLDRYFSPGRRERPALAALRGATLADFVAASALDISPTTDDRPFFYDATRGLDSKLTRLLVGALLACALVMLVPLGAPSMRQRIASGPPPLLWALFAAGLGTGFMMVEIHLLQRFGLFLGYPTLTLAVALFGLLLGTGAGSLVGGWCRTLAHPRGLGLVGVVRRLRLLSLWVLARWCARWGVGVAAGCSRWIDAGSRRAARNVVRHLFPLLSALGWFTTRRDRPLAMGCQWFLLSAWIGGGRGFWAWSGGRVHR